MAIRVSLTDKEKDVIKDTVKRYNSKISRNKNKGVKLPASYTVKQLSFFTSKTQLNSTIHSMNLFLQKDSLKSKKNKKGIEITNYEYKELQKKVNRINYQREKRRKRFEKLQVKSRGTTIDQLNKTILPDEVVGALNTKKFKFEKMNNRTFESFLMQLDLQDNSNYYNDTDKKWIQNYIKGLNTSLGGYSPDRVGYLEQKITELYEQNPEKMIDFLYAEREAEIDFIYSNEDASTRLDILENIWSDVYTHYEYD